MKKLAFVALVSCMLVLLIGATTVSAAKPDNPPPIRYNAFVYLPDDMPELPGQSVIHQSLWEGIRYSLVPVDVPIDAIGYDNPAIEGD